MVNVIAFVLTGFWIFVGFFVVCFFGFFTGVIIQFLLLFKMDTNATIS